MVNGQFLKKHIYKYKYKLITILVFNLILLGINLGNTYITGKYLDLLVYRTSINTIYIFTLVLFLLGLLNVLIGNINNYISTKNQANMVFDINFEVLKYVKKLPIQFFDNIDSVYLNQRINSDSNTIVNFITAIIVNLIPQGIIFIVAMGILKEKNTTVTIVILLSIPLYLILYFIFEKVLYRSTLDYKEKQNEFFSNMNKHLTNVCFIKLNVLFDKLDNDLLNSYPRFLKSLIKYIRCNYCFSSLGSILENIFNVFLFLYGGLEIVKGKITVGDFIIIKSYYLMLLGTVSNFTGTLKAYPEAKVSFNRILEILDTTQEPNGEKIVKNIETINIEDLNLTLNKNKILSNINYTFKKGNVYLIKGYNGAGKSSFIKTILGLYINEFKGSINYNNLKLQEIDLYDVRETKIAILDQEPLLIHSNIYENLTYNNDNIDIKRLNQLIEEFDINSIYIKYKDSVDEDIKNLSGGEKQKISIIRTLMRNTDVIVMDEPTSALDIKSIEVLKNKINEIKENKIIIIISHDDKLNNISDEVIQLEKHKFDTKVISYQKN